MQIVMLLLLSHTMMKLSQNLDNQVVKERFFLSTAYFLYKHVGKKIMNGKYFKIIQR